MSYNPKRWIGSLCTSTRPRAVSSLAQSHSCLRSHQSKIPCYSLLSSLAFSLVSLAVGLSWHKKHSQFPSGTRGIPTTRCLPHFGLRLPHLLPRAVVAAMMANIVAAIVAAIMAAIVPAIATTSWLSDVSCLRQPSRPGKQPQSSKSPLTAFL